MRVDSTRLRVDRIDTHLRHTNRTTLRVESTRDFLLCNNKKVIGIVKNFNEYSRTRNESKLQDSHSYFN
jgi:hypothetical protein